MKQGAGTWAVIDSKDNAVATATKAADVSGRAHYITTVLASFSDVATKLLQIKDGATVVAEIYVVNSAVVNFSVPLKCSAGNAVSAVLDASGMVGVLGKVTLVGYSD